MSIYLKETFNVHFLQAAWLANIAYALTALGASTLTILGFKYIEAQKGSIILLLEIIFGVLLGFVLYQETLSVYTILGGLCILVALILPNVNLLKVERLRL